MKQLFVLLITQWICSVTYLGQVDYKRAYNEALEKYNSFEQEHGHFVQTKNVNLHYYSWGKKSGKPVIDSYEKLEFTSFRKD